MSVFPHNAGNFDIANGVTDSNIINGRGYGLAGFYTDPTAMTGSTITVKLGPDDVTVPTDLTADVQDSSGNLVNVITLHANAGSGQIYCPLPSKYFHTVYYVQLVSASAEGAARVLIPVWVKYSD